MSHCFILQYEAQIASYLISSTTELNGLTAHGVMSKYGGRRSRQKSLPRQSLCVDKRPKHIEKARLHVDKAQEITSRRSHLCSSAMIFGCTAAVEADGNVIFQIFPQQLKFLLFLFGDLLKNLLINSLRNSQGHPCNGAHPATSSYIRRCQRCYISCNVIISYCFHASTACLRPGWARRVDPLGDTALLSCTPE